jgi:adenylate cyclase
MESTPPTNQNTPEPASEPASAARPVRVLGYRPRTRIGRWAVAVAPTVVTALFRRHRRSHWVPKLVSLLISCVVFGIIVFANERGWLQRLECILYDVAIRGPLHRQHESKPRVAVIGVTEDDIQSGRVPYPMSDAQMAQILDVLLLPPSPGGQSARAVGLDIYRDRVLAPDVKNPAAAVEDRQSLLKKLSDPRAFSPVLLGISKPKVDAPGVPPKQRAATNIVLDKDSVVRHALLAQRLLPEPNDPPLEKQNFSSLGMAVALAYLRGETPPVTPTRPSDPNDYSIRLGRAVIQPMHTRDGAYVDTDVGGTQIMLDFAGYGRIRKYSVSEVLDGKLAADEFAGRAVFIGVTSQESVKDHFITPVDSELDGVMLHAMTADQVLRQALDGDRPLRFWPDSREYGWAAIWTLVGGAIGFGVRVPWRFAFALAGAVVLCGCLMYRIFAGGTWVPAVPSLIGCLAAAGFVTQYISHHERAERTTLNELFKRMVDEDVAQTLWERRDELLEEGHLAAREMRATVLFTDLEGFTTITEAMDKSALMAFLNDYMAEMSGVVGHKPDAFVNKYIGDAIMAVFGPPLERTEVQARADAVNAVEAALEMRDKLARHEDRWARVCAEGILTRLAAGQPPGAVPQWAAALRPPTVRIRMRIGIQSGSVTAGSLGSVQRLEYTVIGDTVNTAARLESFDKDVMDADLASGGCRILIGQDTLDLLPAGEYITRAVGSIRLKGKDQMVSIHGVVGRARDLPSSPAASVSSHDVSPASVGPTSGTSATDAVVATDAG